MNESVSIFEYLVAKKTEKEGREELPIYVKALMNYFDEIDFGFCILEEGNPRFINILFDEDSNLGALIVNYIIYYYDTEKIKNVIIVDKDENLSNDEICIMYGLQNLSKGIHDINYEVKFFISEEKKTLTVLID